MLKIMLDAGHGQFENQSPCDKSFFEGTNNYLFALALKRELEKYEDVVVFLTRNEISENPSLEQRGELAVENNCDVFFSIHSNANANPLAYGVEGFYSVHTPAAKGLLEGLCNAARINLPKSKVRKVTTKKWNDTDYYAVLRHSKGVKYSMLIELGFHSNTKELACIRLEEWHNVVAELQARVFSDFFGLVKKSDVQYNVICKGFKRAAEAVGFADLAREHGYKVEIEEVS